MMMHSRKVFKGVGCTLLLVPLASLCLQQHHLAMVQQLLVQGILEKDKRLLLQAFFIHPFTRSVARARAVFEAMWEEEHEFLGDYWLGECS